MKLTYRQMEALVNIVEGAPAGYSRREELLHLLEPAFQSMKEARDRYLIRQALNDPKFVVQKVGVIKAPRAVDELTVFSTGDDVLDVLGLGPNSPKPVEPRSAVGTLGRCVPMDERKADEA